MTQDAHTTIVQTFKTVKTYKQRLPILKQLFASIDVTDLQELCETKGLHVFRSDFQIKNFAKETYDLVDQDELDTITRERDDLANELDMVQNDNATFSLKEWKTWLDRLRSEPENYRIEMMNAICETCPKMI